MTNQQVKTAAIHILEDRKGADYYQDPSILAGYLQGTLGISESVAIRIARDIKIDRDGANYYADADILADFLEGRVGVAEAT